MNKQLDDFIQGQKDARDGKLAKKNASKEYNAGFELVYVAGEIKSAGKFN